RTFIADAWDSLKETATGTIGSITGTVNSRINETLGLGYVAEVERTREQEGVFLDNLRPVGIFYENQSIRLMADFKVRSYIDEVDVEFFCAITDRNGKQVMGTITPNVITVSNFEDR